ncbi:MAG: 50S ribosomal protein L16 [Nanoarchaeota archaeon]
MATLRKANAYSKKNVTPYTRTSKRRQKSFIKTVPAQKIVKFSMGKVSLANQGKLPHKLVVLCTEKVQIRHNALEACRQYINKQVDKELAGQYSFQIIPFPHHIQRENKMLTGAGADRMQTGMQLSFGKCVGKSAIMKKDSKLFVINVANPKAVSFVRKVLKQVKPKLPCKTKVLYEDLSKKE